MFSTASFRIPDFQRIYSWTTADEVSDFWNDLAGGIDSPPYFLGLLIITDEDNVKTLVDGQQRIVTLTLLANSVRKAAAARGKTLVADSMRDVFLYAIDYERESRSPRVSFSSARDRETLHAILEGETEAPSGGVNEALVKAQLFLDVALAKDLENFDSSARLGKWAHFISNGITFALFEHPDRSAAYKVFEVVNTRGKDLTPAELIKSFVIGSAATNEQSNVYERWTRLEDPFVELNTDSQFTQFIRHVVTLRHGYIEPRDLYEEITKLYEGSEGIERLLRELDREASLYQQMMNPPAAEPDADSLVRGFIVLDALGLRTIRPIFMAITHAEEPEAGIRELVRIVVPRLVAGAFGTGSVERQFAEAARDIFSTSGWRAALARLDGLKPTRRVFEEMLATRAQNKGVLLVVRSAARQDQAVPLVDGYLHQIRPRNAESWPGFDDQAFKELGATAGNSLISSSERRPRNTNSLVGAVERLFPTAVPYEDVQFQMLTEWTAEDVRAANSQLAARAAEVFYD